MRLSWKAILWVSILLAWSPSAISQWCVNGFGLPTFGGGNPSPHPVCSLCERDKAKPKASDETCTNAPCFSATGVFEQVGIDLEVAVPSGPPLVLGRLYRTSNVLDGMTGPGWKSSAGARLWAYTFAKGEPNLIEEGAYVTFPDGLRLRFIKQANGTFQPPSGRYDVLTQKADGSYELTIQRSSTRYRFNQTGAPVEIEDENGNKVTYETDGNGRVTKIRDATGRYIEIVWGASGRISGARDQANRTVSYGYSTEGMLTSVTDTAGRTSTYEYTPGRFGLQLSAVKDPWGRVLTSVTYDATGRVSSYTEHGETYTYTYRVDGLDKTKKTDSSGTETILEYTQTGQITRKTEAGSVTEETGYNADGSVAWRYGAMRESSTNVHDGQGRLLRREEARGTPLQIGYDYTYDADYPDKTKRILVTAEQNGPRIPGYLGWEYEYEPAGSVNPGALKAVKRIGTDGTIETLTTYETNSRGQVTKQTDASGGVTDYAYDGQGNLQSVTGPANNTLGTRPVTSYTYDGLGRVLTVTDPEGRLTSYSYDALGRILTVTLPQVNGRTFTTVYAYDEYEASSQLLFTRITDPNGKVTRLGYDQFGRLRKSIDAANAATVYGYTKALLTSITDANGNVTGYEYDGRKRLSATVFPDGARESYTYRNDGLLETKTDRRGIVTSFEYDVLKRMTRKTYSSGGSIVYTYEGSVLKQVNDTVASPAETHVFGYDTMLRMTSATQGPRGTLTYTYANDRVATMQIQGGPSTTYAYHPDGSLKQIDWSPVPGSFTYAYTPGGQYSEIVFPNGQKRTYGYDAQGRLTQLTNTLGATTLAAFSYGYDLNHQTGQATQLGQRTSLTMTLPHQNIANAEQRFFYDALYQLNKVVYPSVAPFNAETHEWTYDAIGNRLTNTVNAATQNYTYLKNGANPNNGQRLANDGVNAYTYDAAGNAVTRTGFTFGYNADNRLVSISGTENATYTYDYQGRRTSKTVAGVTTTYLYDGLNLIAETTGGVTSYFLNGPGIDEPLAMSKGGQISYLSADALGTIVATSDPAGAVTHSAVFDAWGMTRSDAGTRTHPFTYTGREAGEANALFYRARFYQTGIARFTQEDPRRTGDGARSYLYVDNTPITATDPEGLETVSVCCNEWDKAHVAQLLSQAAAMQRAYIRQTGFGDIQPLTWSPSGVTTCSGTTPSTDYSHFGNGKCADLCVRVHEQFHRDECKKGDRRPVIQGTAPQWLEEALAYLAEYECLSSALFKGAVTASVDPLGPKNLVND